MTGESPSGLRATFLYPGWDTTGPRYAVLGRANGSARGQLWLKSNIGYMSAGVGIVLQMFHNVLTKTEEYVQRKYRTLKSEIAQRTLSDSPLTTSY